FQLIEFVFGERRILHFTNHVVKSVECFLARVFRLVEKSRNHLRWTVVAENVIDPAVGFDRNLLFEDELAIHAARSPSMQRLIEQSHGVPLRGTAWRNRIANGHGGQSAELFFYFAVAFFFLWRFGRIGEWWRRTGGNICEVLHSKGNALIRLYVTQD